MTIIMINAQIDALMIERSMKFESPIGPNVVFVAPLVPFPVEFPVPFVPFVVVGADAHFCDCVMSEKYTSVLPNDSSPSFVFVQCASVAVLIFENTLRQSSV